MKFLTFLFMLCCFTSLFCETKTEDRIYLESDQVAIHDNQLFVFLENQWVTTEAIFSDGSGFYILGRKWYEPWECSFCGAVNPPTNLVCWHCNR